MGDCDRGCLGMSMNSEVATNVITCQTNIQAITPPIQMVRALIHIATPSDSDVNGAHLLAYWL